MRRVHCYCSVERVGQYTVAYLRDNNADLWLLSIKRVKVQHRIALSWIYKRVIFPIKRKIRDHTVITLVGPNLSDDLLVSQNNHCTTRT